MGRSWKALAQSHSSLLPSRENPGGQAQHLRVAGEHLGADSLPQQTQTGLSPLCHTLITRLHGIESGCPGGSCLGRGAL